MRGCLSNFVELDAEWDNFVQSMDKITERLLGPFNIVMVVEPINIKISEAIMNFQVKLTIEQPIERKILMNIDFYCRKLAKTFQHKSSMDAESHN